MESLSIAIYIKKIIKKPRNIVRKVFVVKNAFSFRLIYPHGIKERKEEINFVLCSQGASGGFSAPKTLKRPLYLLPYTSISNTLKHKRKKDEIKIIIRKKSKK